MILQNNLRRTEFLFGFYIICLLFFSCSKSTIGEDDYVDPFIYTEGDHGQWDPSAQGPFGMVKSVPDSYPDGVNNDGVFAHYFNHILWV